MSRYTIPPCPFCRGVDTELNGAERFYVVCQSPDCESTGPIRGNPQDAIAAWDIHAPLPGNEVPVAEPVERGTLHDRYTMAALTGLLATDNYALDAVPRIARKVAGDCMKARQP